MSKDPKSYRVPILRLKDVAKEEAEETDGTGQAEQPKKKKGLIGSIIASAQKDVSEDDIAAAVITPIPTGGKKLPKEDIPTGVPRTQTTPPEATQPQVAPIEKDETVPKIKEDIPTDTSVHQTEPEDDAVITQQFKKEEKEEVTEEELGIQIPEGSVLSTPKGGEKVEGISSVPLPGADSTPQETLQPQGVPKTEVPKPESTATLTEEPIVDNAGLDVVEKPLTQSPSIPTPPETEAPIEETPMEPVGNKAGFETLSQPPTPPREPVTPESVGEQEPSLSTPMFEIDEEKSPVEDDSVDFGAPKDGAPLDIWEQAEIHTKDEPDTEEEEKPNIDRTEMIGGGKKPAENVGTKTIGSTPPMAPPTKPAVEEKPMSGGSNLASLRQKIMNETKENAPSSTPGAPVGLGGVATPEPKEEERPRPNSKHASAIADVADKLGSLSGAEAPEPTTQKELEESIASQTDPTQRGSITTEKPTVPVSSVPLVRTFKGDVESAIMKNQTSVVDMVTAEQNANKIDETVRKAPRARVSPMTVILMWSSAGLVLTGMAVGTFFIFQFLTTDRVSDTPEIVKSNQTQTHDITGQGKSQILQGLTNVRESNASPLGTLTELQIVESRGGSSGSVGNLSIVKTASFFEKLNSHAPGTLIRATADDMTIGLHKLVDNEVFWVFKVEDYQNASRGMFEWEEYMHIDLSPLFGKHVPYVPSSFDATGSEGTTEQRATPIKYDFEDVTVANTATRGLRGGEDNYILLWSMPDRDTVVIASSFETMETLIKRMQLRAN